MKKITIGLAAGALLLLSACASTGMRAGMAYEDGSYYSAAAEGRGDYYAGRAEAVYAYGSPWDYRVGFQTWGGYCPPRYRYCASVWADPFLSLGWYGGFYSPFYDPFWYEPWLYYRHPPQPYYGAAPPMPVAGQVPRRGPGARPDARMQPGPWEERPSPRRGSFTGGARPRSRAPAHGDGAQ